MLSLTKLRPKISPGAEPTPRLWIVFFSDGDAPAWWVRFLKPGFRHVSAAAYYPEQYRWVYFNPTWRGTVIEVYANDEFDARLGQMAMMSGAVLRFRSRYDRSRPPALWYCVGAVKALLGLRSCALVPTQMHRHLLAHGAEPVEVPSGHAVLNAGHTEGESQGRADAGVGGEACAA